MKLQEQLEHSLSISMDTLVFLANEIQGIRRSLAGLPADVLSVEGDFMFGTGSTGSVLIWARDQATADAISKVMPLDWKSETAEYWKLPVEGLQFGFQIRHDLEEAK